MTGLTLHNVLDTYAHLLRNEADKDYVSARIVYRLRFEHQFLWLTLQCLEKYMKSTFLFQGTPIPKTNHDINKLFELYEHLLVDKNCRPIRYPDYIREFLARIVQYGADRYALSRVTLSGPELYELDETAWCLRRYCRRMAPGAKKDMEGRMFKKFNEDDFISSGVFEPDKRGGLLEQILASDESDERATICPRHALQFENAYVAQVIHDDSEHLFLTSFSLNFMQLRSTRQWLQESHANLVILKRYIPGVTKAATETYALQAPDQHRSWRIITAGKTPVQDWIYARPFVASKNATVFHRRGCRNGRTIVHKLEYDIASDAVAAGRSPASCCM